MSSQDANDRCLSHGLGSEPRGTLESKSEKGPASLMAHQPSGDVGCISCSQEFSSRSQGPPCACPLRQHIGGVLLKSPGGFVVTSTLQTGIPNPPVVPREVEVPSSSLHPGGPQLRWRHEWICLHLERCLTVYFGCRSCIQPLSDLMRWCRRGRGFVCMHFPRSLCSRGSWKEFPGTEFYYFSLPGGREEYGSQI